MSGMTWDEALAQISTTPEERDAEMLKKIASTGHALEQRGMSWEGLSNEQAAGILEEIGVTPTDFARLVEQQKEEGAAAETPEKADPEKAEGADPEKADPEKADPEKAEPTTDAPDATKDSVPEGEVEFSDEAKKAFQEKVRGMTQEQWVAFIDELTDEQAENVMRLIEADPEKVAAWAAMEEAAYYGTMRAFRDAEAEKVAAAEPTAEETAMDEINGILDKHLPSGDK